MRRLVVAAIAIGCAREAPKVTADPAASASTAHVAEVAPPIAKNSDGSPKRLPPGPPSEPPFTLVLAYDDFGPQVLAGQLLGPEWWSWEAGGSWEPDDAFDVRVVVFRGRTRAQVATRYPTVKDRSDYRLVPLRDALRFLDEALADPDVPATLRDRLRRTRTRIVDALGSA